MEKLHAKTEEFPKQFPIGKNVLAFSFDDSPERDTVSTELVMRGNPVDVAYGLYCAMQENMELRSIIMSAAALYSKNAL